MHTVFIKALPQIIQIHVNKCILLCIYKTTRVQKSVHRPLLHFWNIWKGYFIMSAVSLSNSLKRIKPNIHRASQSGSYVCTETSRNIQNADIRSGLCGSRSPAGSARTSGFPLWTSKHTLCFMFSVVSPSQQECNSSLRSAKNTGTFNKRDLNIYSFYLVKSNRSLLPWIQAPETKRTNREVFTKERRWDNSDINNYINTKKSGESVLLPLSDVTRVLKSFSFFSSAGRVLDGEVRGAGPTQNLQCPYLPCSCRGR